MTKISPTGPGPNVVVESRLPTLATDASRDDLLRAIRHFTTALGKRPEPVQLSQHWGRALHVAAQRLNTTIPAVLKSALHSLKHDTTQVDATYLRTVWKGLVQRLGHEPTAFEIDNDPGLPPALAFKQAGLLKEQAGRRPGTLAENSSFKPRVSDFVPHTPNYGKRRYRRPPTEDELRTREVMAKPLPPGVWNNVAWSPVPRSFDAADTGDGDMFEGQAMTRPEPLVRPADRVVVPPFTRPTDLVELPREGGFQITDPEAAKKIATTPPSDKIPVITVVAAMVLGAILVRYGGPAMMRMPVRSPLGNPAFGSGCSFLTPRERYEQDGG